MNILDRNNRYFVADFVYDEGGTCGPRVQNNLQLVYLFSGSCTIEVEGQTRHLKAGEATMLLPGRNEYFVFDSPTCHGWAEILDARLNAQEVAFFDSLPRVVPLSQRVRELHRQAMLCNTFRPGEASLRASLAETILKAFLADTGIVQDDQIPLPQAIEKALEVMHGRMTDALDLDTIAKASGVSGPHLIRLFKEYFGSTPIRHLWKVRTDAGIRLLRDTGLSASEIAYRCGFQTPYHFSRMVKQQAGESPRRLRQRAWGVKG